MVYKIVHVCVFYDHDIRDITSTFGAAKPSRSLANASSCSMPSKNLLSRSQSRILKWSYIKKRETAKQEDVPTRMHLW